MVRVKSGSARAWVTSTGAGVDETRQRSLVYLVAEMDPKVLVARLDLREGVGVAVAHDAHEEVEHEEDEHQLERQEIPERVWKTMKQTNKETGGRPPHEGAVRNRRGLS